MEGSKVAIVSVAVLALLGGGVFLATRDNNTKDDNKSSGQTTQTVKQEDKMEAKNIVEIAAGDTQFSTLVTAVKAAGLAETLSGTGPFTVFAPTNAAFEKLPAGTVDTLLKPESLETLKSILTYHVVPAAAMSSDLSDGQELTTVQGAKLKVSISGGTVTLTDAKGGVSTVVKADIKASNGYIHVIDSVVMPQ